MNQINILPDNLVNQIAAGEVVERPSSVVKELVENSIDAKATQITIEIEAGGKKLIKITDNGVGIAKDDLPLVFERHATSKIATEDDLTQISTMGFRGEAVASIGSVAQMSVASRKAENKNGWVLVCEGGEFTDIDPHGMPTGTQVSVRHLFFNTPARLKFMKTDQTEFNHITRYITEVGLIHFHIHFKLIHNGKLIAEYTPAKDLLERMHQIFGSTITSNLLPVHYLGADLNIEGYIGKPGIARGNRQSQYLFVNDRPVKSPAVSSAVQKAFHSLLPHGKYPFFVLNIQIAHDRVDVNVHPRKLEIRFLYQNEIFQAVTAAVKKVLETEVLSPELTGQVRSYWKTESIFTNAKGSASVTPDGLIKSKYSMELSNPPTALRGMARGGGMPLSQNRFSRPDTASINQAMEFTKEMTQPSRALERGHQPLESAQEHATPSLIPVCQIANSYILAHGQEGLVIIDQHAAHERVMYNKFLKQAQQQQNEDPETQKLLVPVELDLSLSEAQLLEENQSILTSIGFEIDHFGGNTFHIHAVPTALIKTDIHTTILEVIDDIKNGDPTKLKEPQHAAICYMACRGAIKFGDPLTHKEMVELIRQMDQQDQKYTCPHGRPTMINLTFAELEKRFGRK